MERVQSAFFNVQHPTLYMVFAPAYMQCLTRALHHFSNNFVRS